MQDGARNDDSSASGHRLHFSPTQREVSGGPSGCTEPVLPVACGHPTCGTAVGETQINKGEAESALSVKVCYEESEISFPDHGEGIESWHKSNFADIKQVIREKLSLSEQVPPSLSGFCPSCRFGQPHSHDADA